MFKVTQLSFADVRIRKPLSMTIDREAIVNYVTMGIHQNMAVRLQQMWEKAWVLNCKPKNKMGFLLFGSR